MNSLVVVEKPKTGNLRLCLDPRHLNKAIQQREHFHLPTIEDISTRLTGAKVFSTLDANHGYWHIPTDPASQRLTTFHTLLGRYCYTRMPFSVKSAQEKNGSALWGFTRSGDRHRRHSGMGSHQGRAQPEAKGCTTEMQ